jgi:hypothetical protein
MTAGEFSFACRRIALILNRIADRAALHALRRSHRTLGIYLIDPVTVVDGVGEDKAADRAMLLCKFRFQTSPALAVTGDHDLAFYADAEPVQHVVIVG